MAVPLQTGRVLLFRPLVGQERATLRQVCVALDILRDVEVCEAVKFALDAVHLLAQVADRLRTRAPYIALVFCHPALEVARPLGWQDKERKEVGNIGGERFFADVGLRAASRRFFRTAIVGVVMGIAVLLVLRTHLGRYRHPALATAYKAAERLRLGLCGLRVAALHHDLLHLVPEPLVHDGRMPPLI